MITQYLLPDSAEQAVAELAPDVAVMGGGTTVMPAVHVGALDASRVVGLARAGLSGVDAPAVAPRSGRRRRSRVAALDPSRAVVRGRRGRRSGAAQHGHGRRQPRRCGGDVAVALLALGAEVRLSSRTVPVDDFWAEFEPGEEIVLLGLVRGRPRQRLPALGAARRELAGRGVRGGLARPRGARRGRPAPGPLTGRRGGRSGGRRGGDRPPDRRGGQRLVPAPHDRAVRPASTGGARCRLRSSSSSSTGARPR